ncbi:flavin-containing monooxygenase [Altererythrobacter sp. MF3-039]|uniref:flavin-containing monooxygenase n=1 Tax=Altererythrobacter sp. MF3-039 TaxID=3252901 RepID=UPI00390C41B2
MADRQEIDAIVVGAGFSGLYMLHKLRGLGFSAKVIETADDVGGTWYWNRYPGARCDIESFEYSFSFDEDLQQEWEWSERYATQPEILRYAQHVAERFDLRRDIQFETRVDSAHWNEESKRWDVATSDGESYSAQYLITGVGCLSSFNKPDIAGLEDFAGETYSTGHWSHEEVDFTGKKVAVIGTGSSAIQSTPIMAKQADHLTIFQRTPNYVVPAQNHPNDPEFIAGLKAKYGEFRQAERESLLGAARVLPQTPKFVRDIPEDEFQAEMEQRWEMGGLVGFIASHLDSGSDRAANERLADFVRAKIRDRVSDPDVAELLTPRSYPFATKRLCVDIGYYEIFNRDNVELVDLNATPIERIEAGGVRTSGALYEADILVLATGFDAMTGSYNRIDIRGKGGEKLKDKWADGPHTHLGLSSVGFPNMFMITGPQSPSVGSNMIVSIEQHVEWISDAMLHLREQGAETFEPLAEAERDWGEHIDELFQMSLHTQANTWYLGSNVPGKPRAFTFYLGGVQAYGNVINEIAEKGYPGFVIDGEPKPNDVDFEGHVMALMPPELQAA